MREETTMLIGCCGSTATYLAIRDMGYDYIELSGRQVMSLSEAEFQDFLALYRATGFPCRGFNDYCDARFPIVGPGCDGPQVREYAREICRRGQALGIRTIGIGAPSDRTLPEGYPADQADREMEAFLRMICPLAEEAGITVLLEAVHAHMCNYMTRTEEAVRMVERLALPNLAMVLDYYHAMVMEEDLHSFGYALPHVRHLHIWKITPGATSGSRTCPCCGVCCRRLPSRAMPAASAWRQLRACWPPTAPPAGTGWLRRRRACD